MKKNHHYLRIFIYYCVCHSAEVRGQLWGQISPSPFTWVLSSRLSFSDLCTSRCCLAEPSFPRYHLGVEFQYKVTSKDALYISRPVHWVPETYTLFPSQAWWLAPLIPELWRDRHLPDLDDVLGSVSSTRGRRTNTQEPHLDQGQPGNSRPASPTETLSPKTKQIKC